jgi:GH18 family chitinase
VQEPKFNFKVCILQTVFLIFVVIPSTLTKNLDAAAHAAIKNDIDFEITAYLPEYRLDKSKIDQICEHVTDLILFSAEPAENGDISTLNRFPKDFMDALLSARAKHKTKISMCIGGGGRSAAFSQLTLSASARKRFSLKILEICESMALDGIDIDWEGDLQNDPEKWKNFGELLLELKTLLEMKSSNLQLSIAIHLGQEAALTPEILKVR